MRAAAEELVQLKAPAVPAAGRMVLQAEPQLRAALILVAVQAVAIKEQPGISAALVAPAS